MLRADFLQYFKDLLEGHAEIGWHAWFRQHEAELIQDLPRMEFLQLKFHNLDEAEKQLNKAGIAYDVSPHGRRERYYALLHPNVLDETGRPTEEFLRRRYGGAVGDFMDGNFDSGRKALKSQLAKIKRRPPLERAEEMGAFCFDGEIAFQLGNREFGLAILELIAALPPGDDLLDPAINRARELLQAKAS
jgi:hypothetical protein